MLRGPLAPGYCARVAIGGVAEPARYDDRCRLIFQLVITMPGSAWAMSENQLR
jgi:hypothetical protein